MNKRNLRLVLPILLVVLGSSVISQAQSRPRRVKPPDTLLGPEPKSPPATDKTAPLLDVKPAKPVGSAPVSTDTTHAYQLLQQKQYAAAAQEAKQIATADPNNSEAWKIAGFSEFYLKQYGEASDHLQKALDLQRAAKQEDSHTVDALAESYILAEKFDRALPLLVIVTTRPAAPDVSFFYYRGLAEFKTGKTADAEKSFSAAVKINPKHAVSLFFLGRIAYERNDFDTAIAVLNRATLSDARSVSAWNLLTVAYIRRAASAKNSAQADADYLNAIRAGENLTRVKPDSDANVLLAQALIGAKQYQRAATVVEPFAASADASPGVLYLFGFAQSQAGNFPKAIAVLERALAKSPSDVNIHRFLGYDYEKTKQYAKAFDVYQKALQVAPDDPDFKQSLERVRPFAKP